MAGKVFLIIIISCLMFATIARSETCFSDTEVTLIDETFTEYEKCQGDLEYLKDDMIRLKEIKTQFNEQQYKLQRCEDRAYKNNKNWMKSVVIGILLTITLI